jgi:hypothetical protein
MPKGQKPDITPEPVIRERVAQVYKLRLLGADLPAIRKYAEEQGWNVCDRTLKRYIRRGDKDMALQLERRKEVLFTQHVYKRRELYARCLAVSDHSTALRVLQDEAKLYDLYPEQKPAEPKQANVINIALFDRVNTLAEQLKQRQLTVDASLPGGALPGDGREKQVDQAQPYPETNGAALTG